MREYTLKNGEKPTFYPGMAGQTGRRNLLQKDPSFPWDLSKEANLLISVDEDGTKKYIALSEEKSKSRVEFRLHRNGPQDIVGYKTKVFTTSLLLDVDTITDGNLTEKLLGWFKARELFVRWFSISETNRHSYWLIDTGDIVTDNLTREKIVKELRDDLKENKIEINQSGKFQRLPLLGDYTSVWLNNGTELHSFKKGTREYWSKIMVLWESDINPVRKPKYILNLRLSKEKVYPCFVREKETSHLLFGSRVAKSSPQKRSSEERKKSESWDATVAEALSLSENNKRWKLATRALQLTNGEVNEAYMMGEGYFDKASSKKAYLKALEKAKVSFREREETHDYLPDDKKLEPPTKLRVPEMSTEKGNVLLSALKKTYKLSPSEAGMIRFLIGKHWERLENKLEYTGKLAPLNKGVLLSKSMLRLPGWKEAGVKYPQKTLSSLLKKKLVAPIRPLGNRSKKTYSYFGEKSWARHFQLNLAAFVLTRLEPSELNFLVSMSSVFLTSEDSFRRTFRPTGQVVQPQAENLPKTNPQATGVVFRNYFLLDGTGLATYQEKHDRNAFPSFSLKLALNLRRKLRLSPFPRNAPRSLSGKLEEVPSEHSLVCTYALPHAYRVFPLNSYFNLSSSNTSKKGKGIDHLRKEGIGLKILTGWREVPKEVNPALEEDELDEVVRLPQEGEDRQEWAKRWDEMWTRRKKRLEREREAEKRSDPPVILYPQERASE